MSFSREGAGGQHRTSDAFAESEPLNSSNDEDGLDIIGRSREILDLSQYIDVLTQSQSQSQHGSANDATQSGTDGLFDDDPQVAQVTTEAPRARTKTVISSEDEGAFEDEVEEPSSEWSEEDTRAGYHDFKNRKKAKRKRVAAETNRIRAERRTKASAATTVVGRKPATKKQKAYVSAGSSIRHSNGLVSGVATFLDEPIPEYILSRQASLNKLGEAGLRYPPDCKDIEFLDLITEEKPKFEGAVKPQREKRDIKLRETGGIIPAPIAQWLRDYQVDGAEFLHERFVQQTGAILGDDMGLGKTIQVIAFLTAAFGKTGTNQDAKRMRKIRRMPDGRWYPRILIVCPGTLMQNWEDELSKWGWWEVYRYHGASPADRKGVLGAAAKGMLEILITTYTTYRNHESEINTIDWDCVIADECHQIKSKDAEITKAMNRINALCRIGLTGTAIQNKYEELWNLLNWARPGAYGSAQEWKQNISNPLKMGQAHDATNAQLADSRSRAQELVHNILPGVFLRRMKTLIAHQLPKKTDRIIFCQLTETQADAYRTFLESDRCDYIRMSKQECSCGSGRTRGYCCYSKLPVEGETWQTFMFPCMVTLQKLANHIALIVPTSTDSHDKQAKDLDVLEIACPETAQDLFRIRDNILVQSQREYCGKWKVLRRMLDFWHSNGDKVLIFSHSVRLLRLLKGLFDVDGTKYNFSYLDGSMKYEDRFKAVAEFNADPNRFVFLISTKAGGVGLNITSANKVVIMDPNWNPAHDLQAQDRAYRIGQTRDVEVFRLVSSGTIEEVVYARQIYKQQQANIGYNASEERRYFNGVMDQSTKRGELFGLENLFSFEQSSILRHILHKTNIAESKAGVTAFDLPPEDSLMDARDDEILSNKSLGITDDDGNLAEIKRLANSLLSTSSKHTRPSSTKTTTTQPPHRGPDPINAILARAGVQYTHENSEVIGRSEIEVRLGKQAMELRHDIDLAMKRVFQGSQSQSHSQNPPPHYHHHHHDDDIDDSNPNWHEQEEMPPTAGNSTTELKINYRYRPDERIRRRQFGSMAESMGFANPLEFALFVESSTQEERRQMLERFYRGRRREMMKLLRGGSGTR